ncbi:Hsp20/alpha crystallin family protein [Mycolicibacterium lacusdiani]|uniref:Hsp20/alpha crystallin family protein n=1 Tax=Mycolicibacterium lacusdiani TaxID=2895283 RepID=UPI001F226720|nr:Hsp20/alpha crystallin family protein [Mycolicibacterium lacusdiani]
MSNAAVQQHHRPSWPDVSEFFSGFPAWAGLRQTLGDRPIKVEDEITGDEYELRAEIPGVDPKKDVDITLRDGVLTIKAERTEKKESNGRSEFSYGSFTRSVTLPTAADEDSITADYEKGILTVKIPLKRSEVREKHITVGKADPQA